MRFNKFDSDYIMIKKDEILQLNMSLNSHEPEFVTMYQAIETYEEEVAVLRYSIVGRKLFALEKANQLFPFYITKDEIRNVVLSALYEDRNDILPLLRYLLVRNEDFEIHLLKLLTGNSLFHYIITHLDYNYFLSFKQKQETILEDQEVFEYENGKLKKRNLAFKRFKIVK